MFLKSDMQNSPNSVRKYKQLINICYNLVLSMLILFSVKKIIIRRISVDQIFVIYYPDILNP